MAQDHEREKRVVALGREILLALETLVREATQQLRPVASETDVLAVDVNPMTEGPRGRRSIGHARSHTRLEVQRITEEPFVARLDVEWLDQEAAGRETLYVTRGSAASLGDAIAGARVVSYQAPLGRIAEFEPGECTDIRIHNERRQVEVRQRVRLRPVHTDGEWDGRDDSFEFATWSAALDSIRAFLEQFEQVVPGRVDALIPDVIGGLLEGDARRSQVRESLRRRIVDRMALRDQPILDRYQGEVFRMPVNRRLMLLGPPGTGKTTTLIKRLAQKRATDGLTEEEAIHLDRRGLLPSIGEPASWVMFSPTELLQLYLRDAFNKDGVPVVEGNLKTWARQRLELGRDVLKVLRTADSGRFRLEENAQPLVDQSSAGIGALQEHFERFLNDELFQGARDAAGYLRSRGDEAVNRVLDTHLASIESGRATSARQLGGILDLSGLQPELERLQEEVGAELKRNGQPLDS